MRQWQRRYLSWSTLLLKIELLDPSRSPRCARSCPKLRGSKLSSVTQRERRSPDAGGRFPRGSCSRLFAQRVGDSQRSSLRLKAAALAITPGGWGLGNQQQFLAGPLVLFGMTGVGFGWFLSQRLSAA